jgi:tetratricopeptide (TPR) repeat protein
MLVFALLPALLTVSLQAGSDETAETDPFVLASSFLVKDAHQAFARGGTTWPDGERKFGEALTLMNLQPRTEANLLRAVDLFNEVSAASPPGTPLNGLARLFRARVQEFYLAPPDPEAARAEYLALVRESSGDPVLEMAGMRLVLLEAFADAPEQDNLARLEELEPLAPLLRSPAGRREFHTAMAFAILDNQGDKNRAMHHFLAADREGLTRKASALRIYLVAGDTAVQVGRPRDAVYFYRKLIETYPRDHRVFVVKERLRKIEEDAGNG